MLLEMLEKIIEKDGCNHAMYMKLMDIMQSDEKVYKLYYCKKCMARFVFYRFKGLNKWHEVANDQPVTEDFIYDDEQNYI